MKNINRIETFDDFGFGDRLCKGIKEAGFKIPSPIQKLAIPPILSGVDVIAQARTGTGKTAAFGLPAIERINLDRGVDLLIITPTRELAAQVSEEIYRLGKFVGIKTGTICGGQSYARQIKLISQGAHALSATPGRLFDLLKSKKLGNFSPSIVVLDEADEMLDMGFLEDIQSIFSYLPNPRQTLLFSATIPKPIQKLAASILKDPAVLKINEDPETASQDIRQLYYVIEEQERQNAVIRLIEDHYPDKAIIFCRTRQEVDRLSTSLGAHGLNAKSLHGDMDQPSRNEVMSGFRRNLIDILVATDVAARGLDIANVTHVFNYHIPFDTRNYIHRIGRTGRAGRKGVAITLVTPREFRQLERIRDQIDGEMEGQIVPSRQQLRHSRSLRLQKSLTECSIHADARELVDNLGKDMELSEAAIRLASLILSQQTEKGPEEIGLTRNELDRLTNPKSKRHGGRFRDQEKSYRSSRRGFRRFRRQARKKQN